MKSYDGIEKKVKVASGHLSDLRNEIGKVVFGQGTVIDSLLLGVICNGHVLVEGVPGIAKTLLIKALAQASGCSSKRVQFTVDLLPTDILGLTTYDTKKGFEIVKGPIFANFVIADEINRSPPKTQSAFIEAMQEKQVTIGKTTFSLPSPFFVMASQNPIENEGVYNLPEAQIDRFLFKLNMVYPEEEIEKRIMSENTTFKNFEDYNLKAVVSPKQILEMQALVHKVYLDDEIKKYILKIVMKTREKDFKHGEFIELGASPRAGIALYVASKARAMMNGRTYVIPQDVKDVAASVIRHRIILSYRARAEKVSPEIIIDEILKSVKVSGSSSLFKR